MRSSVWLIGVTAKNKWDSIIPPEPLWEQYERIIKPNGAILLFGQDKFTAKMILSNQKLHRYNIIWKKTTPTGFLNAKRMPMRSHEDIMVFYKQLPTYNPQKTTGHQRKVSKVEHKVNSIKTKDYGDHGLTTYDSTERYPTSVWEFATDKQKLALHPTQKPLALCRYAIRTYTNEGDIVLDSCCGSGTIPLAAKLESRNYIGMDNGICEKAGSEYDGWFWADVARDRIKKEIDNLESKKLNSLRDDIGCCICEECSKYIPSKKICLANHRSPSSSAECLDYIRGYKAGGLISK